MTLGRNTIMSLSRRYAASESAKKAVARGSWFVKAHHHSEWAVVKYHSGPPFGRPLRYSPLEDGGDGGSFMESAVQSQFSVIGFGDVFSDGQAQAGSAGVFGAG